MGRVGDQQGAGGRGRRGAEEKDAGVRPWRKQRMKHEKQKEDCGGACAACSLTSELSRVRGEMGLSVRCYTAS